MKRSTLSSRRQYPLVVGRSYSMPAPAAERKLRADLLEAADTWYREMDGAAPELAGLAAHLLLTGQLGDRTGVSVVALNREHLAHYLAVAQKQMEGRA